MTFSKQTTWRATSLPARQSLGFTLIEMLITVVLISILAAVALPNYQAQARKARRTDAQILLLETAQKLERCAAQYGAYNNAGCGVTAPLAEHYTITIPTQTMATYIVSAAPKATSPQRDDLGCVTFTLNQNGVRASTSHADFSGSVQCWNE
jgi:type IV pilus assembly protein PilE